MKKIIVLCISILLLCTGCLDIIAHHYQNEDAKEKEEIREKALPIAQSRIKEKYGFDLIENEIDDYKYPCDFSVPFGCDGLSGDLEIYAHHANRKYEVKVHTSQKEVYDNYQKEDLVLRTKEIFSNELHIDKEKLTINVYGAEFMYKEVINLNVGLKELYPYEEKIDVVTYEPVNEIYVQNIINGFSDAHIQLRIFEAKDYNSYLSFNKQMNFNYDSYYGSYNYLDDPEDLLNGYTEYINESQYGRGRSYKRYY